MHVDCIQGFVSIFAILIFVYVASVACIILLEIIKMCVCLSTLVFLCVPLSHRTPHILSNSISFYQPIIHPHSYHSSIMFLIILSHHAHLTFPAASHIFSNHAFTS